MSYDPVQITAETVQDEVKQVAAGDLVEPLTRKEREMMNDLSTEAYGKRLAWQKMLRKGELRPDIHRPASGGPAINIKRLHHFTVNEIKVTMEKILSAREEAARVAKAEAAAKKEADVSETAK